MKRRFVTTADLEEFARRQDVENPGWRERQREKMTADWLADGIPLDRINAYFDGPRLIVKAQQLDLFGGGAPKPAAPAAMHQKPPSGFSPIPGSKHGGYHKREGDHFVYWYPGVGMTSPRPGDEQHIPPPTPPAEAPAPSKITIVRVNKETGKEEEIKPGAPKLVVPPTEPVTVRPAAPPQPGYKIPPKPAEAPKPAPKVMNLAQFAEATGGVTDADVDGHIHAGLRSKPKTKTYQRFFDRTLKELQDKRDATREAYRAAIARGEIVEPPKPTLEEIATSTAEGVSEERKAAARRSLERRKARAAEKQAEAAKPAAPAKQEPLLTVQPGAEEAKGKYETTGYVFGSRAELWALRNSGELEKDPAVAYKLVTKDALLGGKVEPSSFAAEAFAGTRPAAAYLKYRLLQAIQSRPADSADARERFSETLGKVQKSFAELRTLEDMETFMTEISDQLRGLAPKATFSAAEMKEKGWDVLFADPPKFERLYSEGDYARVIAGPGGHKAAEKMREEEGAHNAPAFEIFRSLRNTARESVRQAFGGTHIEWRRVGDEYVAMSSVIAETREAAIKNLETLGPAFLAICGHKISYPYRKKAKSVDELRRRGYVDAAALWNEVRVERATDSDRRTNVLGEAKRIQGLDPGMGELDAQGQEALKAAWSWLAPAAAEGGEGGKGDTKTKRTEKEEGDKYHTILAQERLGETSRKGPAVPGNADVGSVEMAKSLGLNVVEYGTWVSGKRALTAEEGRERQWHTEAAHAALHDLADVLGIKPDEIGQQKRLTIAFGSRGKGRAAAEYYPEQKVINLTKTNGKGSLAHEWGHHLDYMITHVAAPTAGKMTALSEHVARGDGAPGVPAHVYHAMQGVMDAIMFEASSEADGKRASRAHIDELRHAYYREADREKREQRRLELNAAINTHNRAARGKGSFRPHTAFHEAAKGMGDYWCRPREMFARCFESYVADKLEGRGRENTYLVKGTKGGLIAKFPGYFPQGEHRKRVGEAIDQLVAALHADQHFAKSLGWDDWFQAVTDGLAAGPALHIPRED